MAIGQRWVSSSERAIGYLSYSLVATSQDKRQWSNQMTPFSILNVTFQICFSLPLHSTNAVRPTSLLSTLKKNLSLGEGGEGFARPANIQCPLDTSTTIREIMGWKKGRKSSQMPNLPFSLKSTCRALHRSLLCRLSLSSKSMGGATQVGHYCQLWLDNAQTLRQTWQLIRPGTIYFVSFLVPL